MRPDIKYYLIPAAVLVVIVLIILILPFNPNRPASQPAPTESPAIPTMRTPTRFQMPTPLVTSAITPTPLPPKDSTGGIQDQQLSKEIVDLASQKTELRMKTPLTVNFGTISFDYNTDRFSVKLNDPKDKNKTAFESWLKQTYPAIPIDRFAFQ